MVDDPEESSVAVHDGLELNGLEKLRVESPVPLLVKDDKKPCD